MSQYCAWQAGVSLSLPMSHVRTLRLRPHSALSRSVGVRRSEWKHVTGVLSQCLQCCLMGIMWVTGDFKWLYVNSTLFTIMTLPDASMVSILGKNGRISVILPSEKWHLILFGKCGHWPRAWPQNSPWHCNVIRSWLCSGHLLASNWLMDRLYGLWLAGWWYSGEDCPDSGTRRHSNSVQMSLVCWDCRHGGRGLTLHQQL